MGFLLEHFGIYVVGLKGHSPEDYRQAAVGMLETAISSREVLRADVKGYTSAKKHRSARDKSSLALNHGPDVDMDCGGAGGREDEDEDGDEDGDENKDGEMEEEAAYERS